MRREAAAITAAAVLLLSGESMRAAAHRNRDVTATQDLPNDRGRAVVITGRVHHIYAARLFTVDQGSTPDSELLVFVPNAEATPLAGTTVEASGVLRRFADTTLEGGDGWNELDVPTRERLVTRPVLVATSLTTATGRQLTGRGGGAAGRGTLRVEEPARSRLQGSESLITVPPATLAVFIQSLAGHSVRVPNARVVGVFTPRVFLIDSQSLLYPVVGNRSRVLVFIQEGTLRVTPESLVASIVTVSGTARTLLGMQTTRDVPWPASLNRSLVERLEIHAALLAKSVQTAEGVDLTVRSSASPPAGSSQRP